VQDKRTRHGLSHSHPHPFGRLQCRQRGPGKTDDVLTGHLSEGVAKGGMLVTIYELI